MTYHISYNHAIEFVGAIYKYAKYRVHQYSWNVEQLDTQVANEVLDFAPSPEVKNWLKYIEDHISPFMRNDILLMMNEVYGILDIGFRLVLENNLKEPAELIEAFKQITPAALAEELYSFYDMETPFSASVEDIKIELERTYPFEISSAYMNLHRYPADFQGRLVNILHEFYAQFFAPFEASTYHAITQKIKAHEALLKENPSHFINTIGMGDYKSVMGTGKELLIFISFYVDLGLVYLPLGNQFIIFYGQTIEHRFDAFTMEGKYKAFYKAVADDKRLEIIKLTSKRPWYAKELADHFGLTTATLSYHLNMLLDLEIIKFEPSINNRYYYTTDKDNLARLFDLSLKGLLK